MKGRSLVMLGLLALIAGLGLMFTMNRDDHPADPLIGGKPLSDVEGWYRSEWFGTYSTTFAPWLFHAEHGFIYRSPESTNASMFVYDSTMDAWWWTNEEIYPYVHAFDPPPDNTGADVYSAMLWYFEGSQAPRVFGVVTGSDMGEFLFFNP